MLTALDSNGLIGLSGLIGVEKYVFMLDSGASANFISKQLAGQLGLTN